MIQNEKKDTLDLFDYIHTQFGDIPNTISINANLDSDKFINILNTYFKKDAQSCRFNTEYILVDEGLFLSQRSILTNIEKNIYISFIYNERDSMCSDITFFYKTDSKVEKSINNILSKIPEAMLINYDSEDEDNKDKKIMHVINYNYNTGYFIDYININKVRLNDIKNTFDKSVFVKVKNLIGNLKNELQGKLYLLVGERGNGKNKILNSIISNSNRIFLYLPINIFTGALVNHDFINFIKNLKNTTVIIEDCEDFFIKSQYNKNAEFTKYILGLVDGLFADSLNISFILTMNCNLSKIDSNLLNMVDDSNLIEVGRISKEKANILSKKLGYNILYNSDVRLTDIMSGVDIKIKKIGY